MGNTITERDLCLALSEIFVDNHVDYENIARIAKNFTQNKVEVTFFKLVAPICFTNSLSPTPDVWAGFDDEQLWREICKQKDRLKSSNIFYRMKSNALDIYLRWKFGGEWEILKSMM
jgi:hypothetical protein